jgi:hypothetical protein
MYPENLIYLSQPSTYVSGYQLASGIVRNAALSFRIFSTKRQMATTDPNAPPLVLHDKARWDDLAAFEALTAEHLDAIDTGDKDVRVTEAMPLCHLYP